MIPVIRALNYFFDFLSDGPGLVPSTGIGGTAGICRLNYFYKALITPTLHTDSEEWGLVIKREFPLFSSEINEEYLVFISEILGCKKF